MHSICKKRSVLTRVCVTISQLKEKMKGLDGQKLYQNMPKTQMKQFKWGLRRLLFTAVITTSFTQMKSSTDPHIPLVPVPVYLNINNTPDSPPLLVFFTPFWSHYFGVYALIYTMRTKSWWLSSAANACLPVILSKVPGFLTAHKSAHNAFMQGLCRNAQRRQQIFFFSHPFTSNPTLPLKNRDVLI